MKILQINSVCGHGSTGRIATDLADVLREQGHDCRIAYGRGTVPEEYRDIAVRIGNDWDVRWHGLMTRAFDSHGFHSTAATRRFLRWADEYDPDLLWLHNIHGYYVNVELLFEWIKKRPNMQVRWTLHDCWAFTGHCSYFTAVQCEQWRVHCSYCVQKKRYPKCLLWSRSSRNFARKRAAFTGVEKMTLITPSKWLADLVEQSFLKDYPVEVHYNAIDRNIFKPTPSDFREKYGLTEKIIILGIANVWDERKGLDDFIQLASMLDDRYAIVLVGLTQKQMKELPSRIVGLGRTDSAKELAEIYTAADVFVNPTYEDNFPTTNLEALACGTPVVTYRTGGSPEALDESCGIVTEQSVDALAKAVQRAALFDTEACVRRARKFGKKMQFEKYLQLYESVI